ALRVDLEHDASLDVPAIEQARESLSSVVIDDDTVALLCTTAMRFGIASIRASLMAVKTARALAALDRRAKVEERDAAIAARLVLAPRATMIPPMEPQAEQAKDPADAPEQPEPPQDRGDAAEPPAQEETDASDRENADMPPEDVVLEAVLAAIPKGLLDRLREGKAVAQSARSEGRAGVARQSLLRGRPAGVRRGDPGAGVRLNLIETLRAAAPWQSLRRAARAADPTRRIEIRREDFHVTRFQQRTQTTTVFVVDASGSSALNRLAEAKGAVELLLADCYVRRDQVAVISFRGRSAELLLPPTRSLVRAKRNLAGLPGGSGTPLAAAIDAAVELALRIRRSGQTVTLVFLTDGQANVARDGSGGRERATTDALAAARRVRAEHITTLFVDISVRVQPQAQRLASEMNAHYLPLPYADAASLSTAVKQVGVG
ncbi:MAG: VWA domain-containing protein, partial [Dokdonella sp.]